MGKPSSSCLKIIACGSDSPVEDDIEALEAKGSSDKRGWSFRKRSARHRVLSNSVTTETLTLRDKEAPQSTSIPTQTPANPSIPEKVVALEQSDEKPLPPLSNVVKPVKSIEPELSQTLTDAAKPPKSVQPEVSETLQTPEPQEQIKPEEVSEAVHASESPELIEPKKYDTVYASEAIPAVAASVSEPPVPIESKTSEVVVPPESPETVEPELSERVVASQDDVLGEPMAQGELVRMKSIVKLQAVIRGHLVRRQAVDTLYCMQGIVKVQSRVKARHSKASGDEILTSHSSTEKLLRNAFARQLLCSTPKTKSTVIKCDPLKPSSSRLWLERWMDLYSHELANLEKVETRTADGQSQVGRVAPRVESEKLLKVSSDSINQESIVEEASNTFENGKSSINLDSAEECQTSHLSANEEKMEQPHDRIDASSEGQLEIAKQKNKNIQSSSHSQAQSGSLSNDLAVEAEDPKIYSKGMASKQGELENKKLAYGSKKSSNPSFIAAQSKFEELSSTANYSGSLGSTHQMANAEYNLDTASSREESFIKEKEPSGADFLVPYDTRVNMGGSENGTELSVTSALDSPYLSEAEAAEMDLAVKYGGERSSNPIINESSKVKAEGSAIHESDLSSAVMVDDEFHDSSKPLVVAAKLHQAKQMLEPVTSDEQDTNEYVALEMAVEKSERSASDVRVDSGSQIEKLPGASPNDNNHRTPSSQVSGKRKKSKVDKSESNTKHTSLSAGKKTPAKPVDGSGVRSGGKRTPAKSLEDSGVKSSGKRTPTKSLDESGVRSSAEHLSKDQKNERRRNSFGSTKSDNDQEPRDSTSSTKTLPSYMQATKSAKAKVNSPRASPDIQDNDTYMIKKRHSLPGAGGRQVSPRVERPTSQAPQSQPVKGNTSTPPQERKWIR